MNVKLQFQHVASVVALFVAMFLGGCGGRSVNPAEVESSMKQAVPMGSSHGRVSQVLDSFGIEHSPYNDSARRILAIKRRTKKDLITRADIQVTFDFDSSGALVSIRATEVFTGP